MRTAVLLAGAFVAFVASLATQGHPAIVVLAVAYSGWLLFVEMPALSRPDPDDLAPYKHPGGDQ